MADPNGKRRVLPWWVRQPGAIPDNYRRNRKVEAVRPSGPRPRVYTALGSLWVITGWDWPRRILNRIWGRR